MLKLTNNDKISRTICGMPLFVNNIEIYPTKVLDILDIGEQMYGIYITVVTDPRKILANIGKNIKSETEIENIDNFNLILILSHFDQEFKRLLINALEFFLKKYKVDFNYISQTIDIYDGENKIYSFNKENYDEFIDIIKLQNYMKKTEEKEEAPANKRAKELLEKKKKTEEQIKRVKGTNEGDNLNFYDYLTIIGAKSSVVDFNIVKDMTVYSFYEHVQRLVAIDQYDIGVKQLLAGAKPKDVELKHWLSKL